MRRELFQRGVISPADFEAEVRDQAIRSQQREALNNPFQEEAADLWELRLTRIREHLTDFYFAYNLPYEQFENLVRQVLAERGAHSQDMVVQFNPELAPQDMLFEQALTIENMEPNQRAGMEARLREIKVVLIRTLISDQLAYVNIAKEWLTIADLGEIRWRKIGSGKIGGKAAGMLLASRILQTVAEDHIKSNTKIPESYFIGADITYRFMALNNLAHWGDQKYKSEEQIRAEYPRLRADFAAGNFPPDVLGSLREVLQKVGRQPLIVRSSSLLEDNFGTSFAGKYESHFCPNQGSLEENLVKLAQAIQLIYASVFNPDALMYRRSKELQDYDERMAILLQVVEGETYGRYFLPHGAGVAFSRNQFRWSPQIRREDGFVRLVWGLGTRAVDRVGNDYPRLVALSHPLLHPESSPKAIRRYSQHYVDLIDLQDNTFTSLTVEEVISSRYPPLRYVAQIDDGGYLRPIRSSVLENDASNLVITFDEMLRRTPLAARLREILKILEKEYRAPVDTEFTVEVLDPFSTSPNVRISLLQCRPQSHLRETSFRFPTSLDPNSVIFATQRVVPQGHVDEISHVVFVPPEGYYALPSHQLRVDLGRAIGILNNNLKGKVFICVGPGRWGTSNSDLGVVIGYADIYHSRALVEVSGAGIGSAPEPSFGTHFFQDLVESQIYPLAIFLDDPSAVLNREFFYETPNRLAEFLPGAVQPDWPLAGSLRLIAVNDFRQNAVLRLVMDDDKGRAVAYLVNKNEIEGI